MSANPVTEEDRELAELCDSAGADLLRDGDVVGAGDLWDASDFWEPLLPDARFTARMMLLSAALDAAEPLIRADADSRRIPGSEMYMAGVTAERERIRQQIDPAEMRKLADWFDTDDEFKTAMFPETWSERGHELQDWLRASADLIEGDDQ